MSKSIVIPASRVRQGGLVLYTTSMKVRDLVANGFYSVETLDPEDPKYTGKAYFFKNYSKKTIKSSNGSSEERFVISTKIRFHWRLYTAEFSLTFRGDMRYPVLIGRKFLAEHHFIVNPQLRNYLHQMQKTNKLSMD